MPQSGTKQVMIQKITKKIIEDKEMGRTNASERDDGREPRSPTPGNAAGLLREAAASAKINKKKKPA